MGLSGKSRVIDRRSFSAGAAVMHLHLLETGKNQPFRVRVTTKSNGKATSGYLGVFDRQEDAQEVFESSAQAAEEKGWGARVSSRTKILPEVPAPPGEASARPRIPDPPKRRGRPRHI